MAQPYLALRPAGNGLDSHNVVAGSKNPTVLTVGVSMVIVKGMIWKKIRPVEVKSMGTACMVNETKVDEERKITESESE